MSATSTFFDNVETMQEKEMGVTGVCKPRQLREENFFTAQGTRHPLETSAGTRYLRAFFL